ncbi:MAG TPA: ImmA/IrrE family metallo-endopeptidase [Gemmataceae bacterium]|jgi:Zn-dependent peptidase ImmA (M78 family)|nr:ImmA/IrrE family metallo-endopeptidase [Gemmataceae bacterium]
MEDLPREEIAAVIDQSVADLLRAAGVVSPPVDAIGLARGHLGMEVCLDRRQPQRGRAQRAGGQKHIYLRPEPTLERHQWTVAHEVGEFLKPALLQRLGIEPERARAMAGESLASLFAYHLLVPACWLVGDAPLYAYDVLELKKRYATASHEVIAWRLLDLTEPCIITVIDNDHIHRRRSNAWPVRKRLDAPEKKCQEYVHYYSRPHRVQEDGWTVHGWPIHQADWKREILRSVVEVD